MYESTNQCCTSCNVQQQPIMIPVQTCVTEICYKKCKKKNSQCVCMCKAVAVLAALLLFGLGVVVGALAALLDPTAGLIALIVGAVIALLSLILLLSQLIAQYCSRGGNPCKVSSAESCGCGCSSNCGCSAPVPPCTQAQPCAANPVYAQIMN